MAVEDKTIGCVVQIFLVQIFLVFSAFIYSENKCETISTDQRPVKAMSSEYQDPHKPRLESRNPSLSNPVYRNCVNRGHVSHHCRLSLPQSIVPPYNRSIQNARNCGSYLSDSYRTNPKQDLSKN